MAFNDKDVKIRIKVDEQDLDRGLRRATRRLDRFAVGAARIGRRMLGVFTRVGAALGLVGGVGLGGALRVAASYQQLQLRLEAVTGSAERAARVFKEVQEFAASTPFQLEDLVKAKILLQSIGLTGEDSLRAVGEAAIAMGRPIDDVARALIGMEREVFKNLTVGLRTVKDQFTFTFRDRAGKEITKVVDGLKEAREEAVKIFDIRFGGSIEKMGATLSGRFSTLTDKIKEAMNALGEGLLPTATSILEAATKSLQAVIDANAATVAGNTLAALPEEIKKSTRALQQGPLTDFFVGILAMPTAVSRLGKHGLLGGSQFEQMRNATVDNARARMPHGMMPMVFPGAGIGLPVVIVDVEPPAEKKVNPGLK